MKSEFNLEELRLPSVSSTEIAKAVKTEKYKKGDLFLKGPIPMTWLERAGQQPGKSLHVGINIWFWAGIKKSRVIKLSISKLIRFGVKRNSAYRALISLETAELIAVNRHIGRSPIITILDCEQS